MVKKVGEKSEKKYCVNCGSKFVYVRIKDNEVVCRSCGHIEKLEDQE